MKYSQGFTKQQVKEFTEAYIRAAMWSSNDEYQGEEYEGLENFEVSPEMTSTAYQVCGDFMLSNMALLDLATDLNYSLSLAGHDLWLTRCGHGAGYWDRGLGDIGEMLTKAADACGESFLYIGDDGRVYCD